MKKPHWPNALKLHDFKRAFATVVVSVGLFSSHIHAATVPQPTHTDLVYVGMNGSQVRALRFDAHSGALTPIGPVADVPKPRWAVAHPHLPVLYVAGDGNGNEGSVIAFSVNRETGALTKVSEVASGGSGTTHLCLDIPSLTLLAANFGGGSTSSIAVNPDGSLGTRVSTVKSTGSGPHRRQASPHAHGVAIDASGRYAIVSDMGADRVFIYRFDRSTRVLSTEDGGDPRAFVAPAGSGPRHTAFGLDGRFVYLLNELTAVVMSLRWDTQQGSLSLEQSLPISSAEFQGVKSGSEIATSHDGRFVYIANRGENTLMVYRVHPESGMLSLVQRTPSGGELPWSFAIHPSGKWMLVANERSNSLNLFRIDPLSGLVSDTGQSLTSPNPVSVTFVE